MRGGSAAGVAAAVVVAATAAVVAAAAATVVAAAAAAPASAAAAAANEDDDEDDPAAATIVTKHENKHLALNFGGPLRRLTGALPSNWPILCRPRRSGSPAGRELFKGHEGEIIWHTRKEGRRAVGRSSLGNGPSAGRPGRSAAGGAAQGGPCCMWPLSSAFPRCWPLWAGWPPTTCWRSTRRSARPSSRLRRERPSMR